MAKPKGRGYSLNIYIAADQTWLREALEKIAQTERRSLSEIVMGILESHVKAAGGGAAPKAVPFSKEAPGWVSEKVPDGPA